MVGARPHFARRARQFAAPRNVGGAMTLKGLSVAVTVAVGRSVGVTVALAWLSFHAFELPLARRLRHGLRARAVAVRPVQEKAA